MNKEITTNPGTSPADMIQSVIAGGVDPEYLKDLLAVQKDWEANEARKAYHVDMAKFKENPPQIDKDKTVKFTPQGKSTVQYNHASLANVVSKITTELSKHGFSASWSTEQNGNVIVTCCITHRMGHSERTTLQAPSDTTGSKNAIQAIGSTISYLQRYTLLSATGLATADMDNDGAEVEKISEEQIKSLLNLTTDVDSTEGKLLKFMGLEKLEDMPKSEYQKAVVGLEAKKNEQGS